MPTLGRIWKDCAVVAMVLGWLTWQILAKPPAKDPIHGPAQGWRSIRAQSNLIAHMAYFGRQHGGYPETFGPIEAFMRERELLAAFAYTRCVGSIPVEQLEAEHLFDGGLYRGTPDELRAVAKAVGPFLEQPGDFVYVSGRTVPSRSELFSPGYDRLGFMLVMVPYRKEGIPPRDYPLDYPEDIAVQEAGNLLVLAPAVPLPFPQEQVIEGPDGTKARFGKKGSHFRLQITPPTTTTP